MFGPHCVGFISELGLRYDTVRNNLLSMISYCIILLLSCTVGDFYGGTDTVQLLYSTGTQYYSDHSGSSRDYIIDIIRFTIYVRTVRTYVRLDQEDTSLRLRIDGPLTVN